jgi:exonuclease VII small subunit
MSDSLLGLCASLIRKLAKKPELAGQNTRSLERIVEGLETLQTQGKAAMDLYEECRPELERLKAKMAKAPKQKRSLGRK